MGGALGTVARHGVNVAMARLLGSTSSYATATVNLVGSLTIGVLAGLLATERLTMTSTMRTFVFVGILGGFTTFSSFMLDSLTLFDSPAPASAAVNLFGQLAAGFGLVYLGFRLGIAVGHA